MRKTLCAFAILIAFISFGQAPSKISYQAVARDNSGAIISGQLVGIRFTIRSGGMGGVIEYADTTYKTTNQFGLFTAQIGGGGVVAGNFNTIPWASGNIFLEVAIDPAGGNSFAVISNTQFVSVPYALYAASSGSGSSGPAGQSVTWLGMFATAPTPTDTLNAYYNTTSGVSFIWDGAAWDTLAKNGLNGLNGTNGTNGTNGINGASVNWLGNLSAAPSSPVLLDAYYNTSNSISFIWDGAAWDTLARSGVNGLNGLNGASVNWLGNQNTAPASPLVLDAYYNVSNGTSFIWNGAAWDTLAKSGLNGVNGVNGASLNWLGNQSAAPTTPSLLDAYYNISNSVSFIWNGSSWDTLARSGVNGVNGTNGLNGSSINWLGSLTSPPAGAALLDAYYNISNGVSFIWNGAVWDTLAKNGTNGINGANGTNGINGTSINWLGNLTTPPASPVLLDAYYNVSSGASFVWNGAAWDTLARNGFNGAAGVMGPAGAPGTSINWLGHLSSAPPAPALLDAYYNSVSANSFIWNGSQWDTLSKSGTFVTGGALDHTIRHNGTSWVSAPNLRNNGNFVAVGTGIYNGMLNIGDFPVGPELEFVGPAAAQINSANSLHINSNNGLNLQTAGTDRLLINNSGDIGIGTTTPSTSAVIDMVSTSKGILIPRMTQAQRLAITLTPTGLLVYQTDAISGFYYFDGVWKQLLPSGSVSGWSLSGNLLSGSEFIGTTNSTDLNFKTAGAQNMVLTTAGKLGVGTNTYPTEDLQVESAGNTKLSIIGGAFPELLLGSSANHSAGGIDYDLASNYLRFKTNGTVNMQLNSNGDLALGISGTPTPNHLELGTGKSLMFEGSADDAFETVLGSSPGITSDRFLMLPNVSGTLLADPNPTPGNLVYMNAAAQPNNLAIGSAGQVLTVSAGLPVWSTISGSSIAANNLDYSHFKNAMTLDSNLTISQGTFQYSQVYSGVSSGYSYTANNVSTNNAMNFVFNGLSTGKGIRVQSSSANMNGSLMSIESTGGAGTGSLLNLQSSLGGTNNTGLLINTTGSGATDYGMRISNTGSNTNVGAEISASGGANNFALLVPSGSVGIGTPAPTKTLGIGSGGVEALGINGADGDISFANPQGTIVFPSVSTTGNPPMIEMFSSGTANSSRMVIGHSQTFQDWGMSYDDGKDAFNFQSNVDTVFSVDLNMRRIRYKDGTQGDGKVLISDQAGFAMWAPGSYFTSAQVTSGAAMGNIAGPTPIPGTAVTYTKNEPKTNLEVIFQGDVNFSTSPSTSITIQIRLDNSPAPNMTGNIAIYQDQANAHVPVTIHAIFTNIPPGTHTANLYVIPNGGGVNGVQVNQNNVTGGGAIIIKEVR